jgi:hypothetical protein
MADVEAQLERAPASKPSSGKLLADSNAYLTAHATDLSGAASQAHPGGEQLFVQPNEPRVSCRAPLASRFVPKPKPKLEVLRVKNGLGLDLSHVGSGINGDGAIAGYFPSRGMKDSGLLTSRGSRKGKERVEPEPEPFEKVTTPTFGTRVGQ